MDRISRSFIFLCLILTAGLAACASEAATPTGIAPTASSTAAVPTGTAATPPYPGPQTSVPTQAYPGPEGATATTPATTSTGASPAPSQTLPATSPVTLTPTQPLFTPTFTPTPTATPGPSPTPTPLFLVLPGTPVPLPLHAITSGNASQVSGLAEWQVKDVTDLAWTPDGMMLAVAHSNGITLFDTQTRLSVRELYPRSGGVVSLAFSPNGTWLAAGSRQGSEQAGYIGNVELWRGPYWQPMGILFAALRGLSQVSFSPDSKVFAIAQSGPEIQQDSAVNLADTATWAITRTLQTGATLDVTFSPNGQMLATLPDRYAARLWRLRDGKLLDSLFSSFTGAVNKLVFSPDGRTLATGHADGDIRLWDVASGKLLRTVSVPGGAVESLAFSPDGSLLASGHSYQDQDVRLWEVATGELLRTLPGHTHAVGFVLFAPDGQTLVSASYDGTLRLWGVRP